MKTSNGFRHLIPVTAEPAKASRAKPANGITTSDRIAGVIQCSAEATVWMALAGLVVAIFTLRFGVVFFIAFLAVIFGKR